MRRQTLLALILLAYGLITIGYGVANPLFEAPDEHSHYFTTQYIAETGRLPVVEEEYDEWTGQEAAQPPLYYLLGAPFVALIDTGGARQEVWLNPYAWIGDASTLNNLNWVVHTPAEGWPWRGWPLAAHLLRLLSTLFGAATLLAIYGSGRLLWAEDDIKPLLATALVAFLPQFNFIHATVTNDSLITFLCSAAIYQLLSFWRRYADGTEPPRLAARLVLLGLTIGLAALTKTAGILLLVYSLGFLGVLAWRYNRPKLLAWAVGLTGGAAVLVAGWLWWRNFSLYGDPTAANQFIRLAGGDRNASISQVLGETDGLLTSLVAIFGWFNLRAPAWVYWTWWTIALAAGLGGLSCLIFNGEGSRPRVRRAGTALPGWALGLMLAGWVALVYAGLFSFMLRTEAAQGRLLFPAILPISLGVAWGLVGSGECGRRGLQGLVRKVAALPAMVALLTTIYCLVFVVQPAYVLPAAIATVPAEATPVLPLLVNRGDGMSLLAAQVETATASPGDPVWLTLYWRADDLPADAPPPEVVMEVFGRDNTLIANLQSYNGRGQYPATLWPPGAIIADRFPLQLQADTQAPVLGRIFARLADGNPGIEIGRVKIVPERWPEPPAETLAEIGDHIAISGALVWPEKARPGETVHLDIRWYVPRGAPGRDFTTLVHLGQPDQVPLVTGDSPPLGGAYPTSAWAVGETINDSYQFVLPASLTGGRYPIWIGLYDPDTGQRLPVTVGGQRQPNNIYLAGWVEIACAPDEAGCTE